ncbi:T9SS type A sorting domain-containing protein, partial [bacterium]|nr:T9SS type A sorting domain-containing protein [bacterium]
LFGLPDLYDYGYDSNGTGSWSVMSGGCWGNGGVTPVHFDAWSKIEAGFVEVVNVVSDETDMVIPEVETNDVIYKLWTLGSQGPQYFLVENRQQTGFDQYLPGNGLMIYHIEEASGNNSNQWYPGYTSNGHYLVAVEQADGDWDLEHNYGSDSADPWPGSSNNRMFNAASTPDSKDYGLQETDVVIENISDSGPVMTADFLIGIFIPSGREVVLTPDEGSLSVPANGGTVSYNAAINNYEPAAYTTQFWINVILPSGDVYGPLLGPVDLTVSGMSSVDGDLAQMVPGRAPEGNYTIVAYVGTYATAVDDSSFFTFNKSATTWANNPTSNLDGWEVVGGFDSVEIADVPQAFYLQGAYPNPFNPTTKISFTLPEAAEVSLIVFDVQGREVAMLVDGYRAAGQHEVTFDAAGLSSGVYLYQLKGGSQTAIGKMILTK